MPAPRSRKDRLNELQKLHTIYFHAADIMEARDVVAAEVPDGTVRDCMAIKRRAQEAFFRLTGLFPWTLSLVELNNTTPSPRVAAVLAARTAQGVAR